METLTIIDMQEMYVDFIWGKDFGTFKMIDEIKKLIVDFRERGLPIILVEFDPKAETETIEEIRQLLDSYDNLHFVVKDKMGGGEVILKTLNRNNLPKNLIVCGLYGDQCVFHTVKELLEYDYGINITVPKNAIWPAVSFDGSYLIDTFSPRLTVVDQIGGAVTNKETVLS